MAKLNPQMSPINGQGSRPHKVDDRIRYLAELLPDPSGFAHPRGPPTKGSCDGDMLTEFIATIILILSLVRYRSKLGSLLVMN